MKGISLKKENDIYEITISSPIQNPAKTKASASDISYDYYYKLSSSSEWSGPVTNSTISGLTPTEKYDFKVVATRAHYYDGVDGYLMERKINIPEQYGNDPQQAVNYLVSSGQMGQQTFNDLRAKAGQMGCKF